MQVEVVNVKGGELGAGRERTLLKTSLATSRDAVGVPTVISDLQSDGIFSNRMTKKVLVPLTHLLVPSGEVPIPWQRRPSLLEYELFQNLWKSRCCLSCQYSKV